MARTIRELRKRYSGWLGALRDAVVLAASTVFVFAVSAMFDLFNKIISWIYRHDTWQMDELFTVAIYLVLATGVYAFRRYKELDVQIHLRRKAEQEKERLIPELDVARADVQRLRNLLPICASCKKVRRDSGYWEEVEIYVEAELNTRLAHGLCPECAKETIRKRSEVSLNHNK